MGLPKYQTLIIQYRSTATPPSRRCAAAGSTDGQPDRNPVRDAEGQQERRPVPVGLRRLDRHRADPGARPSRARSWRRRPRSAGPAGPRGGRARDRRQGLVPRSRTGWPWPTPGYPAARLPAAAVDPAASAAAKLRPGPGQSDPHRGGYKIGPNGVRIDPRRASRWCRAWASTPTGGRRPDRPVPGRRAEGDQRRARRRSRSAPPGSTPSCRRATGTASRTAGPPGLTRPSCCRSRPGGPAAEQRRQPREHRRVLLRPAYDELFAQQSTEFDAAQRAQTMDQMQRIFYRNAVDTILSYPDNLGAVRSSAVKGFFYGTPNAQGFSRSRTVRQLAHRKPGQR